MVVRLTKHITKSSVVIFFAIFLCFTLGYILKIPPVKLGIDVLREKNFDILQGKRVGVLTHYAAVDASGRTTFSILREALGENLVAIFAPEHGLHGDCLDGKSFDSTKEENVHIYAMYGLNGKPKPEWLDGLDVVVIDLRDIGIRYYTYWSSMIYMLVACAEKGTKVVVLDRPNPLGGKYVGGPSIDPEWCSFLGPIAEMPMFHGMTIGEIANYICGTGIGIKAKDNIFRTSLKISSGVVSRTDIGLVTPPGVLAKLDLHVVKMEGWKRDMIWPETGLEWTETSPRIKLWRDLCDYTITAPLCSITGNGGFGIKFKIDNNNNRHFGNIHFRKTKRRHTETYDSMIEKMKQIDLDSLAGCSTKMIQIDGRWYLSINVVDLKKTVPALFGLTVTSLMQKWSDWEQINENDEPLTLMIKKHIGDREFIDALFRNKEINVKYFRNKWARQAKAFVKNTSPYYLYK
ncbi:MAG: DUF1343 domain-containing protein [Puniceicoccales bacterium]|jgi:uncharacterized protein YbbC (DUF1343 family)|nr:DUF1343 domain-containing protein [Puniceicoccales bacterium]